MKLTLDQYLGKWKDHKDVTSERRLNAVDLVGKVNVLVEAMETDGFVFKANPLTGSIVGGETMGGFRPQDCPIGAPGSSHKEGKAVDLYDPDNAIDAWLVAHPELLKTIGLWFEHPQATNHWSHWTTRPPKSGRRFFMP